jgi:hypothetical protein
MTERDLIDPTPELPDDTPIKRVRFPTRIRNVLAAAAVKTVGEVRETTDKTLLSFSDLGPAPSNTSASPWDCRLDRWSQAVLVAPAMLKRSGCGSTPTSLSAALGLWQLPGVKRYRPVGRFGRRIFSTGYERHFNTHARGLLGCAGTNHHLALASTLKLQHYFVNSKHSGRPIANPPGSDGSGEPIAVLFIRPGILKETITADDRPI